MGLNTSEELLVGQVAVNSRGLRLEALYEHYLKVAAENGWETERFALPDKTVKKRHSILEIRSKEIANKKNVLFLRAGIHGEERK